jgi:NADH dehydrogenase
MSLKRSLMKILVAGGSGFIGTNLCRELDEQGHDVTALARNPEQVDLPAGVDTAVGDVTALDSLSEPAQGKDAIVNLVALSPLFKPEGGDEMHESVHLGGTENLVDAAQAADVDRFLQMSALGADPQGPTSYIRAKGRAEEVVQESSLSWTIIRPSVVFGDDGEFVSFTKLLAPPFLTPLPGGGETRFQPIYVEDLVPMLIDVLESDEHVEKTYELGGPEKLTLAEVAKQAHQADGRSVNVLPIPMGIAKVGLSVLGAVPKAPMGADQYRSLRFDNTTDDNDVEALGASESELTTLSSYLGLAAE